MLKKVVVGALSALLCLCCLTGCSWQETKCETDIVERYADYWDYALGEYTCDYEWETEGDSGGFTWKKYRVYEFQYHDCNGREKSFQIDNLCDYYPDIWDSYMLDVSEDILEEEYTDDIKLLACANQNLMENISDADEPVRVTDIHLEKTDENISCVDTARGIDLKNLTLQNLKENNLNAVIDIRIWLNKTIEEYDALENDLSAIASSVYDVYGKQNICVKFEVCGLDHEEQNYIVTHDKGLEITE